MVSLGVGFVLQTREKESLHPHPKAHYFTGVLYFFKFFSRIVSYFTSVWIW